MSGVPGPLGIGAPMEEEQFTPGTPEEEFLFSNSDRPNEPLTAGAPFGPGPNFVTRPVQTDSQFRQGLVARLETTPVNSPELKAYIDKVRRGL